MTAQWPAEGNGCHGQLGRGGADPVRAGGRWVVPRASPRLALPLSISLDRSPVYQSSALFDNSSAGCRALVPKFMLARWWTHRSFSAGGTISCHMNLFQTCSLLKSSTTPCRRPSSLSHSASAGPSSSLDRPQAPAGSPLSHTQTVLFPRPVPIFNPAAPSVPRNSASSCVGVPGRGPDSPSAAWQNARHPLRFWLLHAPSSCRFKAAARCLVRAYIGCPAPILSIETSQLGAKHSSSANFAPSSRNHSACGCTNTSRMVRFNRIVKSCVAGERHL